jgi:hypothetical protein
MKKSDLENFCFYKNKDGSDDIVAMSLNCFEASVYNMVKNSYPLEKDILLPLFLKEIYPVLWYNNTSGVFRLFNQNRIVAPLWTRYIQVDRHVRRRDANSIQFLESLLDKGQMVMIQTAFSYVRFLTWWNPDYDFSTFLDGEEYHVMIVAYHEDDKIFYVEKMPYNIHKENFVPYELNKQIGVAFKSEIEDACNYFLRCFTLNVNIQNISDKKIFQNQANNFIRDMADCYKPHIENADEHTKYYGIEAYRKFAEFCEEGRDLNKYFITTGWSIANRINYDCWMIYGPRRILIKYISSIESSNIENTQMQKLLIETIKEDILHWEKLERSIVKLIISGSGRLNDKISNKMYKIIDIEDKLNMLLKDFCK